MDNVCLCEAPRIKAKFRRPWECTICGKPEQPTDTAALAKPASSPAGGDVVRCLATGNPVGTDTWQVGRPCRCANCAPLSQSTSAGRVGE